MNLANNQFERLFYFWSVAAGLAVSGTAGSADRAFYVSDTAQVGDGADRDGQADGWRGGAEGYPFG